MSEVGGEAHVLCVGAVVLDHVLEIPTLPKGEEKQVARGSRWSGGGNAATAAVAVAGVGRPRDLDGPRG